MLSKEKLKELSWYVEDEIHTAAIREELKELLKSFCVEPCDWCNDIKGFIGDETESIDVSGFLFCPNCGRRLEVKYEI